MEPSLEKGLTVVLENWERMQYSGINEAEEDAERFETSFYTFMDAIEKWVKGLDVIPSYQDLYAHHVVKEIMNRLPAPLLINFETELELILEKLK